jgi:hemerythrin superfamily protein
MDIYDYLKLDHDLVSRLFKQFDKTKLSDRKRQIADLIAHELLIHLRSEQETFYKVLKNYDITKDVTVHGKKEHQAIEEHITFILERKGNEDEWIRKVYELKQLVDHHVNEEEHEIFKKAKSVLSKEDAWIIKEKMHYLKAQLLLSLNKEKMEI